MKQKPQRFTAFVLAFLMALATFAMTPILGEESVVPFSESVEIRIESRLGDAGDGYTFLFLYVYLDTNPGIWGGRVEVVADREDVLTRGPMAAGWTAGPALALYGPQMFIFDRNSFEIETITEDIDYAPTTTGLLGTMRVVVPDGVDTVTFSNGPASYALALFGAPAIPQIFPSYTWQRNGNGPGPDEFDVTIDDGGTGASANPASAAEGVTVTINAGTREGYVFAGWEGDVTFANAASASTTFPMPGNDVTVTATWDEDPGQANGENITFDPGPGATIDPAYAVITLASGTTTVETLPRMLVMTNAGQRFTGWVNAAGESVRDGATLAAGTTLTATWEPTPANFRIGDVCGDGLRTSADATRIALYAVGHFTSLPTLLAGDVNGDGHVDMADATLLARWLVGHPVDALINE